MPDIEICVESYAEAEVAPQYKVKRIELCSGLDVGGLTPSAGLIEKCAAVDSIETHVLIRPRSGNFNYNTAEADIMKADVECAARFGARGVVFGALKDGGHLDVEVNRELTQLAKSLGLETTFHRAFDVVNDPKMALDQLIELGFDRLLTSGQAAAAIEGLRMIKELVRQADGEIQIMAGGGVAPENSDKLVQSGVDALHFSIRKPVTPEPHQMGCTYESDLEKLAGIMPKSV